MIQDRDSGILGQSSKCGRSRSGWVLSLSSKENRKDLIIGCRWDVTKARHSRMTPRFGLSNLENRIVIFEIRTSQMNCGK